MRRSERQPAARLGVARLMHRFGRIGRPIACLRAELRRIHAVSLAEKAREVASTGEADVSCDQLDWKRCRSKHLRRVVKPRLGDELLGGHVEGLGESTVEACPAHPRDLRHAVGRVRVSPGRSSTAAMLLPSRLSERAPTMELLPAVLQGLPDHQHETGFRRALVSARAPRLGLPTSSTITPNACCTN